VRCFAQAKRRSKSPAGFDGVAAVLDVFFEMRGELLVDFAG
jgi:hypothetical protein